MADEKDKKKTLRERFLEFMLKSPTTTGIPNATDAMRDAMMTMEERKKREKAKKK